MLGWFFDRAPHFPWLINRLVPNDMKGLKALDELANNPNIAITALYPGFNQLLHLWQDMDNGTKAKVAAIKRSISYIQFGPQVTNDFELIPCDKDLAELIPRWHESSARAVLKSRIDRKLFRVGAIIFWSGIVISAVSGIIGLLEPKG